MARRGNDILKAYEERLRADRDRQLVTQSCGFCDEMWEELPLGQVRALALAHRLEAHPEIVPVRRVKRKPGSPRPVGARTLDENIAVARAQGGAGWVSTPSL